MFLAAADRELSGHLHRPFMGAEQHVYVGPRRALFACEIDMHAGRLEAWRLPSPGPPSPARARDRCKCGTPAALTRNRTALPIPKHYPRLP